nr:DNA helicase [Tanacetum cinerariifolium]
MMKEKSYNREELAEEVVTLVPRLNVDQKKIYDLIMDASVANRQELIFVYGHGGTEKTFLWRTIINSLRSHGKIVLAVASPGITFLLLPSGRTTHSRFKLPLELTDESICGIKKNTHVGQLIAKTDLIIWDESPMNDRRCFETLDMTLKDIMDTPSHLFGGKSIVLDDDFRQTLPVKKGASKNMRLMQPFQSEEQQNLSWVFAEWLLDIGILRMIKGESTIYKSSDEAVPLKNDRGAVKLLYPMEYLNTLQFSGFPPHELELKVGTPIMLLRNINLQGFPPHELELKVGTPIMLLRNINLQGSNITTVYKLDIQNLNGDVVELTLWDGMAKAFNKREFEIMVGPIIFAVSSCKVSEYNNRLQLLGTSATHYYFNPEIPELEDLQTQFVERFNLHPPLEISKTKFEDPTKEKDRNIYPLSTLLQQNPDSYRGVRFTASVTVAGINTNRDWYYESYSKCP